MLITATPARAVNVQMGGHMAAASTQTETFPPAMQNRAASPRPRRRDVRLDNDARDEQLPAHAFSASPNPCGCRNGGPLLNKNRKFKLTAVPLQNNSPALSRVGAVGAMIECFDSPGDLNFMEELLKFVWTVRRIGC